MSDPENINSTQYHISQRDFVLLNHLKIKLPNGQITNFDWDKTYIVNAVEGNGKIIDFTDTDTQYNGDATSTLIMRQIAEPDGNDKGAVYSFSVFDLRTRFGAGENITITPNLIGNLSDTDYYYKLTISATNTTYSADETTIHLDTTNNKFNLIGPTTSGWILSSNSNKEPVWASANFISDDTTYDDGRFVHISGDNNSINCTLSGDDQFIKITEEGKIQLIPSGTTGEKYALLSEDGKIVWKQVEECNYDGDTPTSVDEYTLDFNNPTLSLKKNGTVQNSYSLPFKEYFADNGPTTNQIISNLVR